MYHQKNIEFRRGYVNRKRIFEPNGQPTGRGRRGWRRVHLKLCDLRLTMSSGTNEEDESKSKLNNDTIESTAKQTKKKNFLTSPSQDLKNAIKIYHAFAFRSTSYTKRPFVFHLRLSDQSEFLIQANSEYDLNLWIDIINFASACLSAPALPSAITNTNWRRSRRSPLPSSYTRLSYWDQLVDHEERLQKLKVELDEHLVEAQKAKNSNKSIKTEFIERIDHLRQDIERYSVYVELMRKKSNSPEAITLSRHPHINSLVPSKEMVMSLPGFAPPLASV